MTESWSALLEKAEVRELLELIRGDNSLIALAVTQREVSWTQFMGWLLDPLIQGERVPAVFAEELLRRIQVRVPDGTSGAVLPVRDGTVMDVRPRCEAALSDRTRVDLVVDLIVGGHPVRLIIENKMESTEREGQLAGYLERDARGGGDVTRVPVLIDLKERPAKDATCPNAPVLVRDDVATWFAEARRRCVRERLCCPRLVDDYLSVLRAWALAAEVRRDHAKEIEALAESNPAPSEWLLLSPWMSVDDLPYFGEVAAHPALKDVCQRLGLHANFYGGLMGRNDGLQLLSPKWRVCPPDRSAGDRAVDIHFEARGRGHFGVDVEFYPYRGGADGLLATDEGMRRLVEGKKQLLRELRSVLGRLAVPRVTASTSYLRDPDAISTLAAIKFCPVDGAFPDAAAFADALAAVVASAAPIIDERVEALGWVQQGAREVDA